MADTIQAGNLLGYTHKCPERERVVSNVAG